MPEVNPGETEKEFVSRCIPIVLDDGTAKDQEQAAAVCYSMYRESGGKGGKQVNDNNMEHKSFAFEVAGMEGRTIEGYASVFQVKDLGGDRVMPGAFRKTLSERGHKVKLLWQHDRTEPVGKVMDLREDDRGLFVKAVISDTARGRDVLALLQDKAIDGLSIGYDAVAGGTEYVKESDGSTARLLKELRLWEVSLVTFGMNEEAGVTALKEHDPAAEGEPDEKARGEGQGAGGPRQGDGGADVCVCPKCGAEAPHVKGVPCAETACPECGAMMEGADVKDDDGEPEETKATWSTAYVNDLPDSAFLYVESGGEKDEDGKTVPRSLRHFPYKDAEGKVDLPHLRNAIARIPQSNAPGLDDAKKNALQDRARRMLEDANKAADPDTEEKAGRVLAARNVARVQAAIDAAQAALASLEDMLRDAGLVDEEAEEAPETGPAGPTEEMSDGAPGETKAADDAAPDKAATPQQETEQAGPAGQTETQQPPTSGGLSDRERLMKRIAILREQLTEV